MAQRLKMTLPFLFIQTKLHMLTDDLLAKVVDLFLTYRK